MAGGPVPPGRGRLSAWPTPGWNAMSRLAASWPAPFRPLLPSFAVGIVPIVAKDVATPRTVRTSWNDTLQHALDKMTALNVDKLPVAREEAPDETVAMISRRDIVNFCCAKSRG